VDSLVTTLSAALQERANMGLELSKQMEYESSVGNVTFPLVLKTQSGNFGICFSHPLVPEQPTDSSLMELYEYGVERNLILFKPIDAQSLLLKLPEVVSELWDASNGQVNL
jgi:hypothetical protein